MGRILCLLGRHDWGEVKSDEAGPYRTCTRCEKVAGSHRLGSDGYDSMPPPNPGSGAGI